MLESAESRNTPLVDTHEANQNPASVPSHVPTAGTQSRVELSGVVTSLCSNAKEQGQKWITLEGARQIATHKTVPGIIELFPRPEDFDPL